MLQITGSQNNADIIQAVYSKNGQEITQTSSASGVEATNDQIFLQSLTVNGGGTQKVLSHFNFDAQITNVNFSEDVTGVGVVKGGQLTSINPINISPDLQEGVDPANNTVTGLDNFVGALQTTLTDSDINNYFFYDEIVDTELPDSSTADFDIMFANPFLADDFIAVTERNGNTDFQITALDINGNLIAGATTLEFDSADGSKGGYDWNTGYSTTNYRSTQSQWLTVASAGLFGTDEAVYGFRVDNGGGADVKFFGISDTSFVPEPSSTLLLGLGSLSLLIRRKR